MKIKMTASDARAVGSDPNLNSEANNNVSNLPTMSQGDKNDSNVNTEDTDIEGKKDEDGETVKAVSNKNDGAKAEEASTRITCEICEMEFQTFLALSRHVSKAHKIKKVHTCNVCNKAFRKFNKLREHQKVHNPERTLCNCGKCGKT